MEISGKTLEIISKNFPKLFPNKPDKKLRISAKYYVLQTNKLETP